MEPIGDIATPRRRAAIFAITARHSRYFAKNAHANPTQIGAGRACQPKSHPSTPPRVDYAITALGQSLFEPIGAMAQWAIDKQPDILKARDQFDRQH